MAKYIAMTTTSIFNGHFPLEYELVSFSSFICPTTELLGVRGKGLVQAGSPSYYWTNSVKNRNEWNAFTRQ